MIKYIAVISGFPIFFRFIPGFHPVKMVITKKTISAMIKIIILVMLIRKCRKSSIIVNIKSNVTIHPCHVTGAGPYPTIFLPNHDF